MFKVNNKDTRTTSAKWSTLNSVIVVVGWVSFKNINKRNIETNQTKIAVVLVKNEKE